MPPLTDKFQISISNIDNNRLTGEFPTQLAQLSSLDFLNIGMLKRAYDAHFYQQNIYLNLRHK